VRVIVKPAAAVLTFFNTTSGMYAFWDDFARMIGERLARLGVDNVRFRRDYNQFSDEPAEARHPTPERALSDLRWLRENVRPIAARYQKVIFHTHGHYQPIWLGREVWQHRRARWFWTEHLIADPGKRELLKKSIRVFAQVARLMPSRLYGVSEPGAARLREQFLPSTVRCIRTGVRLLTGVARTEIPAVPRKALFVGRLIEEKGFWPLLKAFVLLRQRNIDVTLTLVGPGALPEIQAFIDANGLREMVKLEGFQRETRPYYQQADFVIVPSLWLEALGMVSVEARMYGLPVIYSRRGGLPGTQIDGVTGLALAQVTPEEIADKVAQLVSDPARYREMCRRASIGLGEFSIETMVDCYVNDYMQALATL
jgi:glycosyltransferase involved in cell wall biosynthesis